MHTNYMIHVYFLSRMRIIVDSRMGQKIQLFLTHQAYVPYSHNEFWIVYHHSLYESWNRERPWLFTIVDDQIVISNGNAISSSERLESKPSWFIHKRSGGTVWNSEFGCSFYRLRTVAAQHGPLQRCQTYYGVVWAQLQANVESMLSERPGWLWEDAYM